MLSRRRISERRTKRDLFHASCFNLNQSTRSSRVEIFGSISNRLFLDKSRVHTISYITFDHYISRLISTISYNIILRLPCIKYRICVSAEQWRLTMRDNASSRRTITGYVDNTIRSIVQRIILQSRLHYAPLHLQSRVGAQMQRAPKPRAPESLSFAMRHEYIIIRRLACFLLLLYFACLRATGESRYEFYSTPIRVPSCRSFRECASENAAVRCCRRGNGTRILEGMRSSALRERR